MASFEDLAQAAVTVTGRADVYQSGAIWSLLGQVVSRVILFGKYGEDYRETLITLAEPTTYHTAQDYEIDQTGEGIRTYEVVQIHGTPLEALLPRDVLMSPNCPRLNSYYRSGARLEIMFNSDWTEVLIGYYIRPPIVNSYSQYDSHWVLDAFYSGIMAGLCAAIYRQVGDKDSYAMYEGEFQNLLALFRAERSDGEVR